MIDRARITDVAPRDGLQNEPGVIPTAGKAELVRALAASGVDEVEVSSFVNPRWVPQLADATALFDELAADKPSAVIYSALVPNELGMRRALEVNDAAGYGLIDKVSVFTAASETFSQKNTNASIDETLERFKPVIAMAKSSELMTRGYISCAIACPYEGPIAADRVAQLALQLIDLGIDEIDLGDTIGAGTPETMTTLLHEVIEHLSGRDTNDRGDPILTLHLHDTFGTAAACIEAAIDMGVRSFDASAAGLGGCPFAGTPEKPAPGNIAAGLLLATLTDQGLTTSVHPAKLAHASAIAERLVTVARTEKAINDARAHPGGAPS